jgi:hypothetical protein
MKVRSGRIAAAHPWMQERCASRSRACRRLVLVQLDSERASIERQQTAGFVRKEQSCPAHLLIVRSERPARDLGGAR